MPVQTHKRPDLQPAIKNLIASCVPAIRSGGKLPLASVVEAAAGGKLTASALQQLEARGELIFEPDEVATSSFLNVGPQMTIRLKSFNLVVPTRISGLAVLVPGGVELRFHPTETFKASKFFVSVGLERIEVTTERIMVNMLGGLLDQCIQLV
jgi:hypothetical protein